jgi:hypothetical protein
MALGPLTICLGRRGSFPEELRRRMSGCVTTSEDKKALHELITHRYEPDEISTKAQLLRALSTRSSGNEGRQLQASCYVWIVIDDLALEDSD